MPSHPPNRLPIEDPLIWIPKGLTKLYSIWLRLTYPFASVGRNFSIHYTCELKRPHAAKIKLGNSILIGKDAWLNVSCLEGDSNVEPAIVIDDNTAIGPRCQISAKNCICIERDNLISTSVLIIDHNHAYEDIEVPIREQSITEGGRIRIGQGCWIGQGASIVCTKGELTLGRNCVVGANAVVRRSFPAYSVIFGDPAQVIRHYDAGRKRWVPGTARPSEPEGVRLEPPGAAYDGD